MNMEIGTETAQFPEKEYINGIFVTVHDEILFFEGKVAWDGFLGIPSYQVCRFRVSNFETFLNIPFSLTDRFSPLSISNRMSISNFLWQVLKKYIFTVVLYALKKYNFVRLSLLRNRRVICLFLVQEKNAKTAIFHAIFVLLVLTQIFRKHTF